MSKEAMGIGHNSQVSGERIKSFVDRVERIQDQISFLGKDVKEVFAEAKSAGFDTATIRKLIAERKIPAEKLSLQYDMLDLYRAAIGTA